MGDSGALWNCGVGNITKPADEFVIIGLQAGLEYPVSTSPHPRTGREKSKALTDFLFWFGEGRDECEY